MTALAAALEVLAPNSADLRFAVLRGADLNSADLNSADLNSADLRGADLNSKKVHSLRVFTGLYRYEVWAILFADGERWVRMGCLRKSLEEWERIGIRKSNLSEFPNDGSETSEERARAFEFAREAALRMTLPVQDHPDIVSACEVIAAAEKFLEGK